MSELLHFLPPPIISGLAAGGIATALAVAFDRHFADRPTHVAKRIGAPTPSTETWRTSSWPVALALFAGFVAAYRVALDQWPSSPFSEDKISSEHRVFWGVLVFAGVAIVDSLPRIPALVRLSLLLGAIYFALSYVLGSLVADYTGLSRALLALGVFAWFLAMRAGLNVSTHHGSWKPFDAIVIAIAIGFMGAALAGSGSMKFAQLTWGLGAAAGAVALGALFRRQLPTAPAYATVLALSLGTLLLLGIFTGRTPWWAAVIVSLAPAGRFLARVGPLGTLKGWPTLVVRALLVLAPAALGAGLAVLATTEPSELGM